MDAYEKIDMFSDGLEEFDDSLEVVTNLIDEYTATESPDYLNWSPGNKSSAQAM